ncbi:hypothetical protein SEA_SKOG_201 [Gordonia phage Skog]|uniref:DUF1508 domain-containing protein n=1 Tax=Gordonia phage Skog TaxID=2704033 RepID=A0A6G6XKQ6_9CAUD|nr:hypothetical protein KHQ85_gp201 [Gordonia phage Skog]QIG58353.1 hypothetical protein SEA_SKOG_201 [Gordonia phage Skog]
MPLTHERLTLEIVDGEHHWYLQSRNAQKTAKAEEGFSSARSALRNARDVLGTRRYNAVEIRDLTERGRFSRLPLMPS